MNALPKISIITPSYNQKKYIQQAIDSVFAQRYPNLEFIIIDGGSTDGTVDVLKHYSGNPQFKWVSEHDAGQADAINKGLAMATGDIIAYLNSDDYYLPNTFASVVEFFDSHKKAMWVTGDYRIVDEKGKCIQLPVVWYKSFFRLFPSYVSLCITNFIAQPSTFWKYRAFRSIGLFDTKLSYVLDYDYWMRMIKKYPLSVIRRSLSAFRIHKASKGGHLYREQFKEENVVMQKYVSSRIMVKLHLLHNAIIVKIYSLIK